MPSRSTVRAAAVDDLSAADAASEHAALGAEIAEHDRRYYQDDAPTVSDAEYDALRRRYEAIEARFPELKSAQSLTEKVGAKPAEKFAKVRHRVPMLSLANAFSDGEVAEFVEQYRELWEARLDRLEDYLRDLQARPASDDPAAP